MDTLKEHYQELLELEAGWQVDAVDLDLQTTNITILLSYTLEQGACSKCGEEAEIYDHAPEREWRHLDAMQCVTTIKARLPRVNCSEHGVTTMKACWANKHSHFSLQFESFAVKVLQHAKNLTAACKLLRINWRQAQRIMEMAVERGLTRRKEVELPWLGMDEKSFRSGHDYVSIVNDLGGRCVIDVAEGRSSAVAEYLLNQGLTARQREMACGVCIDMSAPFIKAIRKCLEHADIVHDKFHIIVHLNNAVDITRRRENKALIKQGDSTLTGSKYQWLKAESGLDDEALERIAEATERQLEVSKAWHLKELFAEFWKSSDKHLAFSFLLHWTKEVVDSGNQPMLKVAKMIRKHLKNILTYFDCFITNGLSEGINSKIQSIKASARGFKSFKNYRLAILFHCGKLDMAP